MTDNRARLVGPDDVAEASPRYKIECVWIDGEYLIRLVGLDGNIPHAPYIAMISNRGMARSVGILSSNPCPFPLDAQGRIALVGESPEPRGELRRGWVKGCSFSSVAMTTATNGIGWLPIEYRVVGEGGAEKDDYRWGWQHWDGSIVVATSEAIARRTVQMTSAFTLVRVRLTVEPVEGVGNG